MPRGLERLVYPYDLIQALMNRLPDRCGSCSNPATRRIKTTIIVDDPPKLCDTCAHVVAEYVDLPDAPLVRACHKYLSSIEQKTSGGIVFDEPRFKTYEEARRELIRLGEADDLGGDTERLLLEEWPSLRKAPELPQCDDDYCTVPGCLGEGRAHT